MSTQVPFLPYLALWSSPFRTTIFPLVTARFPLPSLSQIPPVPFVHHEIPTPLLMHKAILRWWWVGLWLYQYVKESLSFPGSSVVKKIRRPMQEMQVRSLGWEYPLDYEMATHSNILAWKISWPEEPGRLQSMELLRVGHD